MAYATLLLFLSLGVAAAVRVDQRSQKMEGTDTTLYTCSQGFAQSGHNQLGSVPVDECEQTCTDTPTCVSYDVSGNKCYLSTTTADSTDGGALTSNAAYTYCEKAYSCSQGFAQSGHNQLGSVPVDECQQKCTDTPTCVSYDVSENKCYLSTTTADSADGGALTSNAAYMYCEKVFIPTSAPTSAPTPQPTDIVVNNNPSACVGGGDPHITSFDGEQYTAFVETGVARSGRLELASDDIGEFWLVKNDRVHIQGRYYPIQGHPRVNIKMLAVGGPFLQGNILIVRPVEIGSIQWNGNPILQEKGAEFNVDGLVNASQAPGLAPVWREEPWEKVLLQLPMGVSVQVDRNAKALAFKITMRPLEGGQDGQCGNFNGVAADDTKSEIQGRFDWHVKRADSLFVAAKVSAA